jgi:diguanylate cyclase (GGDEF)-like protein
MPGRANSEILAPPRAPSPSLATDALTTIVVGPNAAAARELAGLVRKALPHESVVVCASAIEAVARAEISGRFGRAAALFIFDLRDRLARDLADELRSVGKANPDAEMVVVADRRDDAPLAACLQAVARPEKLSFLLAPLHPPEAAGVIQTLAERHRAQHRPSSVQDLGTIKGLERELREVHARLEIAIHAARHDGLTGLLNRTGFLEELNLRLSRSRQRQTVLLIDLDRFKLVNDTLGHEAGDDLVRKVCTAMQAVIPADGVLARLGGDEFGIIIEGVTERGLSDFCSLILRVCAQSRRVSGHEVQVTASIGVAHQDASLSDMVLMRHADLALYVAKRAGCNRHRLFDAAIDKAAKHRSSIEAGLERALHSDQFKMAYQPIVKAETGEIQGFEALIRWNSPEHGQISPAEFVPIAEETGLILDLGDWITRQAFKDCRRWGGPYVSVNLSARQFLRHNVAERILQYAEDADVPADRIQIELTETAIIDDVVRAAENLAILRAAGVRVALDDFGTGYSSLVYLNQFAIDCIKIDKSFVDTITRDRQSAVIVASVARLAASLGMSVVAEGVETEEQRQILIAAGCGALQGFHFGRPMIASDVAAVLKGQAPRR